MRIDRLDHLVLTVADIDGTVEFYTRVLGMKAVTSSVYFRDPDGNLIEVSNYLSQPLSPAGGEPRRGCFGFNGGMVVIFGFGPGSPEDQGEVAPCVCPNCHNQVFLHHVRSKKSVSLYFVPVVPYGTDNYLVCPVCSRGLQVSDAQLRRVRSMSSATASFRAGRLSQAQYMAQAELFWRQLGVNPAGQQLLTPASPGAPMPAQPAAPARPAPPPTVADKETSWVSHLHQLAQLHDQGVLSDADYAAAKQRILEQDKQPQPPGPTSPPSG